MSSSRGIVPETAETAANHAVGLAERCVERMAVADPGIQRDITRYFADDTATVAEAIQVATMGPGVPPDWVSAVALRMSAAWDALSRALRGVA